MPVALGADEKPDVGELAAFLDGDGVAAEVASSTADLLARAVAESRQGDALVIMSFGSFDGLPQRLVAELKTRNSRGD